MQTIIQTLKEALLSAHHPTTGSPLYDEREVRSIVDLLIEETCNVTRVDRLVLPEWQPSALQRTLLQGYAAELAKGVPVQQVLGYEWFCGQKFRVTPDVLIPRPETAELVEWICSTCSGQTGHSASKTILDLGTGSGCIAITLARLINNSQVLAADLSTAALSIARQNAYEQGVDNLQFIHCDALRLSDADYFNKVFNHFSTVEAQDNGGGCEQKLFHDSQPQEPTYQPVVDKQLQVFDIIVSNPPYICRKEATEMSPVVLENEPEMALFVPDDDPLLFYRAIARMARQHLSAEGSLFFEINAAYGAETCQMLTSEGFAQVELRQDINGRDRMIRASVVS